MMAKVAPRGDHLALLDKFPRVHMWVEGQTSKLTAGENLRRLGRICDIVGFDPMQLAGAAEKEPKRVQELLIRYANGLRQRGLTDAYISRTFVGLRNWLLFEGVNFVLWPATKIVQGSTIQEEETPTQEQLGRIVARAGLRGRITILLMAQSGLRPGVLGNHDRSDGLRLADLPDLELDPEPRFVRVPFQVIVRPELSKNGKRYLTFGSEAAEAIIGYLNVRRVRFGERLTPSSPLLSEGPRVRFKGKRRRKAVSESTNPESRFVTTKSLTKEVHRVLSHTYPDPTKLPRPYVLRAFFSTQLTRAAGQGLISSEAKEAFMGHVTSTNLRYNFGKRLSGEVIDELREQYDRSASRYLVTNPTAPSELLETIESERRRLEELIAQAKGLGAPAGSAARPVRSRASTGRRALEPGPEADKLLLDGWTPSPVRLSDGKLLLLPPPQVGA
jgi:hypothetical protein